MRTRTLELEAFRSPEVCGQGPYDIVLPAAGASWGEILEVRVVSPHPLRGYTEVLVDGEPYGARTAFGSFLVGHGATGINGRSWRYVHSELVVDNARCLDAPAPPGPGVVVVEAPPLEPASPPVAVAPPSAPAVAVDAPPAPTAVGLEPTAYHSTWSIELGPEWMERNGLGYQSLYRAEWVQRARSLPLTPPLPAGAEIRIRIWSEEPNLLEGVLFVVHHEARQPNVSDEEWLAHLEREDEAARRRNRQLWETNRRQNEARRQRCEANPERDECRPRPRRPAPTAVAQRPPAPPAPPRPDGPPPAAPSEVRPPRPSPNATWISGYWRWYEARWIWSPGGWEIPEEDLVAERTVVAPAPPPALRVEAPPPMPAPRMVWVAGYWQWDGARWVWVVGHWVIPQPDATYVAPRWRARGAGVCSSRAAGRSGSVPESALIEWVRRRLLLRQPKRAVGRRKMASKRSRLTAAACPVAANCKPIAIVPEEHRRSASGRDCPGVNTGGSFARWDSLGGPFRIPSVCNREERRSPRGRYRFAIGRCRDLRIAVGLRSGGVVTSRSLSIGNREVPLPADSYRLAIGRRGTNPDRYRFAIERRWAHPGCYRFVLPTRTVARFVA